MKSEKIETGKLQNVIILGTFCKYCFLQKYCFFLEFWKEKKIQSTQFCELKMEN